MKYRELMKQPDPYCDCGICQYCNGSEDKFGNPTDKMLGEVGSIRREIKMLVLIECSECDEAKTESIPLSGDLLSFRLEFSKSAWKYGWIVEAGKALCPNCRADAEDWEAVSLAWSCFPDTKTRYTTES